MPLVILIALQSSSVSVHDSSFINSSTNKTIFQEVVKIFDKFLPGLLEFGVMFTIP